MKYHYSLVLRLDSWYIYKNSFGERLVWAQISYLSDIAMNSDILIFRAGVYQFKKFCFQTELKLIKDNLC